MFKCFFKNILPPAAVSPTQPLHSALLMGWLFGQLNRQKPTKTDLVSLTRRVGWTSPGLFFPNRRVDETSPRLVSYISCPLGMGAANVAHRPMTEEWEKRRSEIALSTSTPVTYIYVISSLQILFKVSSIIRYDWFSVVSSMKDWFSTIHAYVPADATLNVWEIQLFMHKSPDFEEEWSTLEGLNDFFTG